MSLRRAAHISDSKSGEPVLIKFSYVKPYENFNELKKIQLHMHRALQNDPSNFLVLDLSEWVYHSDEDFFKITMRFLYDFRSLYRPCFIASMERESQLTDLRDVLAHYFNIEVIEDHCLDREEDMINYLHYCLDNLSDTACKNLTTRILKLPKSSRNYLILDRVVDDINETAEGRKITGRMVEKIFDSNIALKSVEMDVDYKTI